MQRGIHPTRPLATVRSAQWRHSSIFGYSATAAHIADIRYISKVSNTQTLNQCAKAAAFLRHRGVQFGKIDWAVFSYYYSMDQL